MYKHGLVIGKFYPPHRGHKHLIDTALAACEKVTVIICAKATEAIPGALRKSWLKTIHPTAEVILLEQYTLGDDDSEGWANYTKELLGETPDAVFTSEDYGHTYAHYLGCTHVQVDKNRTAVPISGTAVRKNPLANLHYLEPVVRAYFIPRIVIVGAESTGTTTLTRDLAHHFNTVWAPEYGRFYSEGRMTRLNHEWTSEEFASIAKSQQALEDQLALQANGIIFADTDAFATSVWHERYMGAKSPLVESIADSRQYALYIVTGDEIPFEQDGTRDGEHIRHWMHERIVEKLAECRRPYIVIRGSRHERLIQAVKAIEEAIPHAQPLQTRASFPASTTAAVH